VVRRQQARGCRKIEHHIVERFGGILLNGHRGRVGGARRYVRNRGLLQTVGGQGQDAAIDTLAASNWCLAKAASLLILAVSDNAVTLLRILGAPFA
jgi:hypothetical protein